MIVKISKGEKGVADYLKTGKKRDSKLTRDEKDDRLPLAGNLDLIEMSEKHQRKKRTRNITTIIYPCHLLQRSGAGYMKVAI